MAPRQSKDQAGASAPTRHLEIETKLELPAGAALPSFAGRRSLVAVGLASAAEPVVFELDAVYFDTDKLDLLRSKLTLRRRTGGEDAGWHLKLPAVAGARTEIGLPLETGVEEVLSAVVPAALADLVQGAARGRPLHPVARIRNRRTVTRLLDPAGAPMVEVADDAVTATRISPPDDGRSWATAAESEPTPWRELEVEVVDGNRDQLAAVVEILNAAGAAPASNSSKLGRALQQGEQPAGKAKGAGPAVVAVLAKLADRLVGTDRALREGTDTAVHDARAAARRLRSVLGAYPSVFTSGATRELRAALREYGTVLGKARDLEVLRDRLLGQLAEEPTEYAASARSRIEQEIAAALPAAMAQVQELIRSSAYLSMLRALDDFLESPPFSRRATKAAGTQLSGQLSARWDDFRALALRAVADTYDDALVHDVRKAARVLRYAAEAAAPALGPDAVVFAAAIEEIQEVLGEHQDALASAAWLAEVALHPGTDGVAGFVFGRLHAFEQAAAQGTLDDFADAWDRVEDGRLLAAAVRD